MQVLEVKKIEPKPGQSGDRYRSANSSCSGRDSTAATASIAASRPTLRSHYSSGRASVFLCSSLVISDGVHYIQGMLATQLNELVSGGALQSGSIIRLNEYICNEISGKKVLIMLRVDLLQEKADPIGNPQNIQTVRPADTQTSGLQDCRWRLPRSACSQLTFSCSLFLFSFHSGWHSCSVWRCED